VAAEVEKAVSALRDKYEKNDIAKLKSQIDRLKNEQQYARQQQEAERLKVVEEAVKGGDYEQGFRQLASYIQTKETDSANKDREAGFKTWAGQVLDTWGVDPNDEDLRAAVDRIPADDPNAPFLFYGEATHKVITKERAAAAKAKEQAEKAEKDAKTLIDKLPDLVEAAVVRKLAAAGYTEPDGAAPGESRPASENWRDLPAHKLIQKGMELREAQRKK